jgi:hypothetical protein
LKLVLEVEVEENEDIYKKSDGKGFPNPPKYYVEWIMGVGFGVAIIYGLMFGG